jgi:ethanolamine permease
VLAVVCLVAMVWFNLVICGIFLCLMAAGAVFCKVVRSRGAVVAVAS